MELQEGSPDSIDDERTHLTSGSGYVVPEIKDGGSAMLPIDNTTLNVNKSVVIANNRCPPDDEPTVETFLALKTSPKSLPVQSFVDALKFRSDLEVSLLSGIESVQCVTGFDHVLLAYCGIWG